MKKPTHPVIHHAVTVSHSGLAATFSHTPIATEAAILLLAALILLVLAAQCIGRKSAALVTFGYVFGVAALVAGYYSLHFIHLI